MRSRTSCHGFTLIEFMLVVVISAILMVGLAAVVDVPLQMAERELDGGLGVSHVDRVMAILDQDVRFAQSVDSPDLKSLLVTDRSGNTISYVWDGISGGGLTRTAPGGSSVVLRNIQLLAFSLSLSDMHVAPDNHLVAVTPIQTASFSEFSLKTGYSLSGSQQGSLTKLASVAVTESVDSVQLSDVSHGGIVFTASGLGADAALPVSVRVRVRRSGAADLALKIFEADMTGLYPDRTREVAVGRLDNAAIPVTYSDVSIPLTPSRNVIEGRRYFLVLRSSVKSHRAADLEVRTLSDPDAAMVSGKGFLYSANSGASYTSLSTKLGASQSVFQLAVRSSAVLGGTDAATAVSVPIAVGLKLQLSSSGGSHMLRTNFTVENQVARVNQSRQR